MSAPYERRREWKDSFELLDVAIEVALTYTQEGPGFQVFVTTSNEASAAEKQKASAGVMWTLDPPM